MRFKFNLLVLAIIANSAFAQHSVSVVVKDSQSKEPLIGATVMEQGTTNGTTTDVNGSASLQTVKSKSVTLEVKYVGYESALVKIEIQQPQSVKEVLLDPSEEKLEEVTVTSVRTNSRIENIPIRVEVLGVEDISEENGIMPGNLLGIVGDVAGIQMQQVSASS